MTLLSAQTVHPDKILLFALRSTTNDILTEDKSTAPSFLIPRARDNNVLGHVLNSKIKKIKLSVVKKRTSRARGYLNPACRPKDFM